MAGTTGAAAYQRLTIPDNEISKGLQYWGGIAAQQGEEARNRAERGQAAKAKAAADKRKADDEWAEKNKPKGDEFKSQDTGYAGADDSFRALAQKGFDKDYSYYKQAKDARERGDTKTADLFEAKRAKLRSGFNNIVSGQSAYKESFKQLVTDATNGEISGLDEDEFTSVADNVVQGKFDVDWDENDEPTYFTTVKDAEGNEKQVRVPNGSLVNGAYAPRRHVKLKESGGFIQTTLDSLGFIKKDSVTGNYIKTNKQWGESQKKAIDEQIGALFATPDSASDVVFQMTNERTPRGEMPSDKLVSQAKSKLKTILMGGQEKENTTQITTALDDLALRKKAAEDKETKSNPYSARHYDIKNIVENNENPRINGKTISREGKKYTVESSYISADKKSITIRASYDGKDGLVRRVFTIPKTELGVNTLLDETTGQKLTFDKVIQTEPFEYREFEGEDATGIGDKLGYLFDEKGLINDDEKAVRQAIREEYPNAKVKNTWKWGTGNYINVNGKDVKLDNNPEVLRELDAILGTPTPNTDKRIKLVY